MAPRLLWWRRESPERYRRIAKVVTLAGYVAGRMAGLQADRAFVDPSYLTWVGLGDTARHRWSEELAEVTGLGGGGLARMPRIVPATEVVGHPAQEAATAGFVGAGLVDAGQLIDVAGTFPVFGVCSGRYFADHDSRMLKPIASPLGAGAWYSMMYINGGGLTHRWFAEQFGLPASDAEAAAGGAAFAELDAAAGQVAPGSDGLFCVPHLMGRRAPTNPRCAAPGSASPGRTGGLALPDAATLGSAIVAGHAAGLIPDMAAAARRVARPGARYLPNANAHRRYRACVDAYCAVLREFGGAYAALADLRAHGSDS